MPFLPNPFCPSEIPMCLSAFICYSPIVIYSRRSSKLQCSVNKQNTRVAAWWTNYRKVIVKMCFYFLQTLCAEVIKWTAHYWSQIMMNENSCQHFGMVLATCRFISWLKIKDEDTLPVGSLKSCSNANIMELLFLRTLIKCDIILLQHHFSVCSLAEKDNLL